MTQHYLPSSTVKDWLAPARRLQGRLDQPQLHKLTNDDFRAQASDSKNKNDTYVPIGQGDRPIGTPIDSTVERVGLTASSTSDRPDNDIVLQLLQGIASGTGLTVLRLSDSSRRHDVVTRYTPHELALAARGLSLQLGVQAAVQRNQLYHLVQRQKERECGSTKPTDSWVHAVREIDVTLVACLQDCISTSCASDLDSNHLKVQVGRKQHGYRVWAMPAADVLAEVTNIVGSQLAQRLFEAKYVLADHISTDIGVQGAPHSLTASLSEGHCDPDEEELTAVLWLTEHRGRPRAWDSRGKPRAYDSRDSRDQRRCRIVPDPLALRSHGGPEHDTALATLQQILLTAPEVDEQNARSGVACWRLVELHAGDIMIADNNILLRHTAWSSDGDSTLDCTGAARASHDEMTGLLCDTAGGTANNDAIEAAVYDEVEVLRSCAESRRQSLERTNSSSNHALWMALRRDCQPLRWWWW